jgi:hypothetical protein
VVSRSASVDASPLSHGRVGYAAPWRDGAIPVNTDPRVPAHQLDGVMPVPFQVASAANPASCGIALGSPSTASAGSEENETMTIGPEKGRTAAACRDRVGGAPQARLQLRAASSSATLLDADEGTTAARAGAMVTARAG